MTVPPLSTGLSGSKIELSESAIATAAPFSVYDAVHPLSARSMVRVEVVSVAVLMTATLSMAMSSEPLPEARPYVKTRSPEAVTPTGSVIVFVERLPLASFTCPTEPSVPVAPLKYSQLPVGEKILSPVVRRAYSTPA